MTESAQTPAQRRLTTGSNFTAGVLTGVVYDMMAPESNSFDANIVAPTIIGMLYGGLIRPRLLSRGEKYALAERATLGLAFSTGAIAGRELTRAIRQYL